MSSQLHLSDEALDDVLIGMGSAAAESHLSGCAECRARMEAFSADLKMLDESSMAWSRVRAAGMAGLPPPAGAQRSPLATMRWAMAGVLLLALVVPVWHSVNQHSGSSNAGSMTPVAVANQESEAQIAADNQLLQDVDAVVNTNEASPFGDMLRTDRPHAQHKARPE